MHRVKIVTTNSNENQFWQTEEVELAQMEDCMKVVNVYPELCEQTIVGFGGAITEASVHSYSLLDKEEQKKVVDGYYGKDGLCYNLARVHLNSCDFALGNYTYIEEGDDKLETFSIEHDKKQIIPFIKEAVAAAKVCHGDEEGLKFLSSPWSPPAFMKTNNEMNHGGKLKEEYYQTWADYYVKYIQEYAKEGIKISFVTIQNEPAAVQTWDSCIYEAEDEGIFARDYLAPAFKKAGLSDIKIYVWDHNKEALYQRIKDTFAVDGARECVRGIAIHWYTGDHFDAIRAVKKAFPEQKVFFTEGCVEYSRFADSGEINKAEMYAHDMLGDLKAGCNAFLDWNLLLDEKGGPNHVGNFCAAPMMADGKGGVEKRLSYYYIGHFSRYISRGARQIMTSSYTDKLETLAFLNKDGGKTVVMLNKTETEVEVTLCENQHGIPLKVAPHSIVTVILTK